MTSAPGRHSLECCCDSVSFDGEGPLEDCTPPPKAGAPSPAATERRRRMTTRFRPGMTVHEGM